mmetsp:Transcript_607/g.821  ORF Transcript_607/g.821 Transcript_607/m.821 type:complete len:208 (-) Transcript_607:536-1159(-)
MDQLYCPLIIEIIALHQFDIGYHHFSNQFLKGSLCFPSKHPLRLGRVTNQQIHLRGSEITRINSHQHTAFIRRIHTNFIHRTRISHPLDSDVNVLEGLLDKFTHTVRLSSRQDIIIAHLLLKHHPHALDVIACVTPITFRIQVTKVKTLPHPCLNHSQLCRNFTRDKRTSTTGRFVIEQNTIGQMHAVRFTVIHENPIGILFRHSIW